MTLYAPNHRSYHALAGGSVYKSVYTNQGAGLRIRPLPVQGVRPQPETQGTRG
jgi:hypothetical protein